MVSTAGGIAIAVVVLLAVAAVGWIVFTYLRARRLGVSVPLRCSFIAAAARAHTDCASTSRGPG